MRGETMEYRQGKCPKCKIAFRWPTKDRPLKLAHCPRCNEKLQPTTRFLLWPWVWWHTSKKGNYYLEEIKEIF